MFRRHDTLPQMALTLAAALFCGALLEAEGLNIWAQRLAVGPVRELALPATAAWLEWQRPLRLEAPRGLALQAKARLAPVMLAQERAAPERTPEPVPVPRMAPAVAIVQSVQSVPASVAPPAETAPAMPAAEPVFGAGVDVALAGDSMMAVGLAPTLKRWLAEQKNVRVVRAYRSGTGLSRPEVFDWVAEYPRMLGDAKPSIVICSMGANDAQSVQVGKKVLQFDTPEWDDFFRARLSAYLDILTRSHPQVLWIGLPEMRSAAFSQKMGHLNVLLKTTLARYPNTTWLDPRPAMDDPRNKGFQQFRAQQNGKLVKVRADDGIHLTDDGALYLLDPIRGWMSHAATGGKATGKPDNLTDTVLTHAAAEMSVNSPDARL
ncbi:hypothetical protein AAKU55_001789 [Oxalobacteraceae bacterium GrIS 1.11]